jgi:hypothetical protein
MHGDWQVTYIYAHEYVVLLGLVSYGLKLERNERAYLFIPNSKFALSLLVVLSEGLELLYWFTLQYRNGKLDIGFCVLVAGLPY